ncbi:chaperone protein DnaJ [Trypanosoma rangeli]|uniref:Chaperone protein DnaJ n=1 Tax=Trypanosoma rangeli TaxID=5698 RepID=A0A3R7LNU2_TRYRA|nr:chaperone protein DnaJ [Trypanosoma rangeli]RNF00526.1 chaperone protein DnaJ [Trypanosoma rangeli]|eukprot:RNF00526.1 chaperone protein DnaJ [Trypanosoma rangeli]
MDRMDDAAVVKHVLSNRTSYYRILFLERNATTEQIRIAYKKMALKCHPDKNKHSGASEAFKIVGTANATLSDATKRHIYDTKGAKGVQEHESGGASRAGAAARRAHNVPNDFFEGFFGRHTNMHTAGAHVYEAEINPNILMAAPLLIFLFLAILLQSSLTDINEYQDPRVSRGGKSANTFSLTPDPLQGHVVERMTSQNGLRVRYYVHRAWAERAARGHADVRRMEREVLQQQQESLSRRCEAESLSYRARGKKDTPPVCSDYEAFRRAAR